MKPFRIAPCVFASALILGSAVLLAQESPRATAPETASFDRLNGFLAQGQVVEGARELTALSASPTPLTPAQEEILRRAIETGRSHLRKADASMEERNASRVLICPARAHFPEELSDPLGQDGQPVPPLRVGKGVNRPELVNQIKPEYPEKVKKKGVTGTVILDALIDREGCVRDTYVLKGMPFGLTESSIAAVKSWAFNPATLNGEPVKVRYVLTISFHLDEKDSPAKDGAGAPDPR